MCMRVRYHIVCSRQVRTLHRHNLQWRTGLPHTSRTVQSSNKRTFQPIPLPIQKGTFAVSSLLYVWKPRQTNHGGSCNQMFWFWIYIKKRSLVANMDERFADWLSFTVSRATSVTYANTVRSLFANQTITRASFESSMSLQSAVDKLVMQNDNTSSIYVQSIDSSESVADTGSNKETAAGFSTEGEAGVDRHQNTLRSSTIPERSMPSITTPIF